jgi:hypothetical protein
MGQVTTIKARMVTNKVNVNKGAAGADCFGPQSFTLHLSDM